MEDVIEKKGCLNILGMLYGALKIFLYWHTSILIMFGVVWSFSMVFGTFFGLPVLVLLEAIGNGETILQAVAGLLAMYLPLPVMYVLYKKEIIFGKDFDVDRMLKTGVVTMTIEIPAFLLIIAYIEGVPLV